MSERNSPGCAGKDHDSVNHPKHYTSHPSGVECIEITEHYPFNIGNAIKYLWRAGMKNLIAKQDIEDLKKARWYLDREIAKRERDSVVDAEVVSVTIIPCPLTVLEPTQGTEYSTTSRPCQLTYGHTPPCR